MTDESLTEDERELLRLLQWSHMAFCKISSKHRTTEEADAEVLAHYRKAKAGSFELKPKTPVYTAADGTQWVEDPDGTHGWWSAEPGGTDDYGSTFGPWRRSDRGDTSMVHGRLDDDGTILRYYRRVS